MGKIVFITGGARSGKSRYAEELLKGKKNVLYVATAIPFDDEMKNRIALHKSRRNKNWETVEAYKDFIEIYNTNAYGKEALLIDCITIMVSNILLENKKIDWERPDKEEIDKAESKIHNEISGLINGAENFDGETVIVSNELGMGLVPANPMGRYYRDIAGISNQMIAEKADTVILMVSGQPVKVK